MKKIKNILILAGGDSTRFWPLEAKNLTYFLGKSLISYQINTFKKYADNFVIVASKINAPLITQEFKEKYKIVVQDKKIAGQAGAIIAAKGYIKGEVLIINASDIFNEKIIEQYIDISDTYDLCLLAKKCKKYFPGGYLKFKNDKLSEIVEKPEPDKRPSDLVRLVVDFFSSYEKLISCLEKAKNTNDDQYEQAINLYIKEAKKSTYITYKDFWYSLKYPWHILSMMEFFLTKIKDNFIGMDSIISKNTILIPPVYIGANVKIGDFAKIVGPAFIGDGTIIADYAFVRNSHIGKNCLIGSSSEVARSYLGNNVLLHRNYVGDSVLDDNVLFGAGAVTANFRFDKKNVKSIVGKNKINSSLAKLGTIVGKNSKVGVNSTILPGVKIGSNSAVGPGSLVADDIEDKLYVFNGKKVENKL